MSRVFTIGVLTVFILGAVAFGTLILTKTVRGNVAQMRGTSFIGDLYAEYTIVGSNCQGEDTDKDSYVSCDFRIKNQRGDERIVHLRCPTIWKTILGNTCKETRFIVTQ
jgi:hypothetical protein